MFLWKNFYTHEYMITEIDDVTPSSIWLRVVTWDVKSYTLQSEWRHHA